MTRLNIAEQESGIIVLDEETDPPNRLEPALECLTSYDPSKHWNSDSHSSFLYWTIRDFAHAYRSKLTTPSDVSYYYFFFKKKVIITC